MERLYVLVVCFAAAVIVAVFYLDGTKVQTLVPMTEKLPSIYYDTVSDLKSVVYELTKVKGIRSAWLREYYSAQSSQRVQQLQSMGKRERFEILYNVIVPEVQCPALVRVGSIVDGGKYVCNPLSIPKEKCRIYSLGLLNEISFDRGIQKLTNNSCKIYGYDKDPQRSDIIKAYKSMNGSIGVAYIGGPNGKSIGDLFEANGDRFADVLKMDVEGAEHSTLVPFLSNRNYSVCQLLVEIHGRAYEHLRLLVSIAQ